MTLMHVEENQDLDVEWVTLIMSARSMGFDKDDVRKILQVLREQGSDGMSETAV